MMATSATVIELRTTISIMQITKLQHKTTVTDQRPTAVLQNKAGINGMIRELITMLLIALCLMPDAFCCVIKRTSKDLK